MQTNEELVQHLIDTGVLRTKRIIDAFRAIDRKDFVPQDLQAGKYVDRPLPIPAGMTISQPTTVAFMLELLQPHPGEKILDVGSGSGWTTALLAELTGENGEVYGVEIVPELVKFGQKNLNSYEYSWATIRKSKAMGLPEHAPYDRVLVSASADRIPEELVDQMRDGGVMVCPVRESIWLIEKEDDSIRKKEFPGFRFVPLMNDR